MEHCFVLILLCLGITIFLATHQRTTLPPPRTMHRMAARSRLDESIQERLGGEKQQRKAVEMKIKEENVEKRGREEESEDRARSNHTVYEWNANAANSAISSSIKYVHFSTSLFFFGNSFRFTVVFFIQFTSQCATRADVSRRGRRYSSAKLRSICNWETIILSR